MVSDNTGGLLRRRVALGQLYEGPPMYGHGGMSAMLIDRLLGHAAPTPPTPT